LTLASGERRKGIVHWLPGRRQNGVVGRDGPGVDYRCENAEKGGICVLSFEGGSVKLKEEAVSDHWNVMFGRNNQGGVCALQHTFAEVGRPGDEREMRGGGSVLV